MSRLEVFSPSQGFLWKPLRLFCRLDFASAWSDGSEAFGGMSLFWVLDTHLGWVLKMLSDE